MPLDVSIVPHVVNHQSIISMPPGASAHAAAQSMLKHDISSMMVIQDGHLLGIVTERDMTRQIVANDCQASHTPLKQIMTHHPKTAHPDDSVFDALERMRDIKVRHLPLVKLGHVVGMVSMRDLRNYIATLPKRQRRLPIRRVLKKWFP